MIPEDVLAAVKDFAAEHGRKWKSELLALWNSGNDTGPLRLARNIIGPSGLYKLRVN